MTSSFGVAGVGDALDDGAGVAVALGVADLDRHEGHVRGDTDDAARRSARGGHRAGHVRAVELVVDARAPGCRAARCRPDRTKSRPRAQSTLLRASRSGSRCVAVDAAVEDADVDPRRPGLHGVGLRRCGSAACPTAASSPMSAERCGPPPGTPWKRRFSPASTTRLDARRAASNAGHRTDVATTTPICPVRSETTEPPAGLDERGRGTAGHPLLEHDEVGGCPSSQPSLAGAAEAVAVGAMRAAKRSPAASEGIAVWRRMPSNDVTLVRKRLA